MPTIIDMMAGGPLRHSLPTTHRKTIPISYYAHEGRQLHTMAILRSLELTIYNNLSINTKFRRKTLILCLS